MKVQLIALAATTLLTVAAPAYAAYNKGADREQSRQEQTYAVQNSNLSEHCQQVMARPDMWGGNEVKFCQNSQL